jgi:hypothetical protein
MIDPLSVPTQRVLISSRAEYLAALHQLLALGRRQLSIFDPNLSSLEIDGIPRIAALRAFLRADRHNSVQIAVHDAAFLRERCPRLLALLAEFPAQLAIHQTEGEAVRAQDCFVLVDELHFVRRPVAAQRHGVYVLSEAPAGRTLRERFNEIWDFSAPAVAASTLGL